MPTTVRVPIDLRNPIVSSLAGNSFWTIKQFTNFDIGVWEFVKDVEGKITGVVPVPSNLAGTPAPAIILVIGAEATSGVTSLNVSNKAIASDAEALDVALTADTQQDITVPATSKMTKEVTFTVGDLANIAGDDLLVVEIFHDGDHANDTLAVNTLLYEAFLRVDIA
jgi:hypothetical protein